jgi:hypothetical protein
MTDNLATQKWRLIGDSGTWYRWFLDYVPKWASQVMFMMNRSDLTGRVSAATCSSTLPGAVFGGAWSQPGIGGRESNLVPVTPDAPLGYTPVDRDYKPTAPGAIDHLRSTDVCA